MRFMVMVLVTHSSKYNLKERLFMGIAWLGKATVQAALSGLILLEVRKYPKNPLYEEYYEFAIA